MIAEVIHVIGPVVLLIVAGFAAVKFRLFKIEAARMLAFYAQNFAVPLLLFNAVRGLDFGALRGAGILLSYFLPGAMIFAFGIFLARRLGRTPGSSVVLGFNAFFGNSLIVGLPLAERAFGTESLSTNYLILALHSPLAYLTGAIGMAIARPRAGGIAGAATQALRELARNPLLMGIAAGLFFNFTALPLPTIVNDAIDLQSRAALPVALFALGGVLTGLQIGGSVGLIALIGMLKMVVMPISVLSCALLVFRLDNVILNNVVLMAAMPTGTNGFIFAALYAREEETAASIVFFTTLAAILLIPAWLIVLGLL